jgi:hypothetical protein
MPSQGDGGESDITRCRYALDRAQQALYEASLEASVSQSTLLLIDKAMRAVATVKQHTEVLQRSLTHGRENFS